MKKSVKFLDIFSIIIILFNFYFNNVYLAIYFNFFNLILSILFIFANLYLFTKNKIINTILLIYWILIPLTYLFLDIFYDFYVFLLKPIIGFWFILKNYDENLFLILLIYVLPISMIIINLIIRKKCYNTGKYNGSMNE